MSMNHTLNHLMVRKLNHCSKHFLAINIVVGSAMKAGSCGFYVNKTHEACSFFEVTSWVSTTICCHGGMIFN